VNTSWRRPPCCRRHLAGTVLPVLLLGACVQGEAEPSAGVAASALTLDAGSGAGFPLGFYLPLNDVVLAETDDVQVVANGNVALSFAGSNFDGAVDEHGEVEAYEADIGLDGALTIEIAVEGSGELSSELDVATIPLPAFTMGPVEVSPFVQVRLLLAGTADAGARVSMVAPFQVGTRFSNSGSPDVDLSSEPRFEPEIGLPQLVGDFEGTIRLEITTTFLAVIGGFPIGGPVIGTHLGANLDIDSVAATWDLDGVGEIIGGWAFPDAFGQPNLPDHFPLHTPLPRWDIDGGSIPTATPTRWSEVFDVERDDAAATAMLAGGDLVVIESGDEPWLASLDQLGAPRWQKAAIDGWTPVAMARAKNGDLLVAGVSGADIRVERYAPSGTPRWRSTMTVPGADVSCAAIAATSTNGAILGGQVEYSNGTARPIVAAIDQLGAVAWSTEVDTGAGSTSPVIEALAVTPTGEILAVGTVDYDDAGDAIDGTNALILRLGAQGVPMSARAVGGNASEEAHELAMYPDGSYAIGGSQNARSTLLDVWVANSWIASLGADDTLRWSAAYQSRPDMDLNGEQALATGLAPLDNHGLLISGWIGSANVDAWILRVNQDGMPVWVKSYATTDRDDLAAIVAMPDGLAAYGSTGFTEANSSYRDLWLLRTSVDGMLHFGDGNGFDAESTAVQWEPLDHTVATLAPVSAASQTLQAVQAPFTVDPASSIGELLTD
jgi:hypothetical protein